MPPVHGVHMHCRNCSSNKQVLECMSGSRNSNDEGFMLGVVCHRESLATLCVPFCWLVDEFSDCITGCATLAVVYSRIACLQCAWSCASRSGACISCLPSCQGWANTRAWLASFHACHCHCWTGLGPLCDVMWPPWMTSAFHPSTLSRRNCWSTAAVYQFETSSAAEVVASFPAATLHRCAREVHWQLNNAAMSGTHLFNLFFLGIVTTLCPAGGCWYAQQLTALDWRHLAFGCIYSRHSLSQVWCTGCCC